MSEPQEEPCACMEMPVQCDCGLWFDLHDGYPCEECSNVQCTKCLPGHGLCTRCRD
jgi:hypothetical protein